MKIRSAALAATFALAIAASASQAASQAGGQLSTGSIELSPKVSFTHSNLKREGYGNVDSFTDATFAPTVGFCLSPRYEVNGGVLLRHSASNDMKETAVGALAGLTYNFAPQGTIIPFVSLGFGVLFYDGFTFNDTAVLAPDLSGGVRVLVGNAGSVNLSIGYQHESDDSVSMNRLVGGVGVSLFPWRIR